MKKITALFVSINLIFNVYPMSLPAQFLAPPGSAGIEEVLLEPHFTAEQQELFEKYYPKAEKKATHYYNLYRFLFQELAGIPFNKFTKEDFTSQAKLTLVEFIALSDPEYLHSAQFGIDLSWKMSRALAEQIVIISEKSDNLLFTELKQWIDHLSEVIKNPKPSLQGAFILNKEDIINDLMRKYEKEKYLHFINILRQYEEFSINPDSLAEIAEQRRFPSPLEIAGTRDLQEYVQDKIEQLPADVGQSTDMYQRRQQLRLHSGIPGGYNYTYRQIGEIFGPTCETIRALEKKTKSALFKLLQGVKEIMEEIRQHKQGIKKMPLKEQLKIYKYLSRVFVSSDEETRKKGHSSGNDALHELWLSRMRVSPYSTSAVDTVKDADAAEQQDSLKPEKEEELSQWIQDTFPYYQRELLPCVLKGWSDREIAERSHRDLKAIIKCKHQLLRKLRLWFTLGEYEEYGTFEQVREALIRLSRETSIQRILRLAQVEDLLLESQGNIEVIKELVEQLSPELAVDKELKQQLESHFQELSELVKRKPRKYYARQPRALIEPVRRLIAQLGDTAAENRRLVLRNVMRNLLYPLMRHDEENNSEQGLHALKAEAERFTNDPLLGDPVMYAYVYYREARQFKPRGFNEMIDGRSEPMLSCQKYGIWESLLSLEEPKKEKHPETLKENKRREELALIEKPREQCAFFTSEARIGKTIMAVLAAFNIKNKKGTYDVQRVLYTTSNQAKFEVEDEVRRRVSKSLNLRVIVIEGTKKEREAQLDDAISAKGNVLLITNYDSFRVKDLPEKFAAFKPDAHIIDEIENLRKGDKTIRAPIIFKIPCRYRIGIAARMVVIKGTDIAEPVSWARPQTFPNPKMIKKLNSDTLYVALNAVSVRWRRSVVLPELGDPEYINIEVPYSVKQDQVIHDMRDRFPQWLKRAAREDKSKMKDHLFNRFDLERRAGVDLSLVLAGRKRTAQSPKIRKLCEIIEKEKRQNGKLLVLVDFVEGIDRLVEFLNEKFGAGTAFGVTSEQSDKSLRKRNKGIRRFRSEAKPTILIGTSFLLGSSLNLFQLSGRTFHISTVVRLSRPWWNLDDGERLIGIGQTHPVKVITLISTFRTQPKKGKPMKTIEEMQEINLTRKQMEFETTVDGKINNDAFLNDLISILAAIMGKTSPARAAVISSVQKTKLIQNAN